MFFKSMEIHGFKSFADKTILNFDTKMTAIVGSNGNGKSNISDALRWVMGEQGAKTLRGDKMEDVIFHGTVSRSQMGYAKVALLIDNTDRSLAIDFDEVTITRKLYRTGESEYLINGDKVRLKDVQELLMGTGLGRDGYSIIGQGRVAEIINSKSNQRREIFEEAAGVSKFLHRKQESERDLAKANDNMLRLLDISKEIEERLPTLEKQSEKAQKARVLVEDEKKLEISVSVNELDKLNRNMGDIEDKILQNQGECEHYEREIGELEDEGEKVSLEKVRLTARTDELRRFNDETKDKIADADKCIAVYENEIVHNEQRKNEIKTQIENLKKSKGEFDNQISELNIQAQTAREEISKTADEIVQNTLLLSKTSDENSKLDEDYKKLDARQGILYAKQTEARISIQQAEKNIEEYALTLNDTKERIENQENLLEDYRKQRLDLTNKLSEIQGFKQEAENKLNGYSRLFSSKKEKLEAMNGEVDGLNRQYQQKRSRFDVLSDVEKNMGGYFASVKSVITAAKVGKISNVHGTVADVINVGAKYGVAIETALGNALQNIIVESDETAKRCIRFLKETNGGRATFLPINSIKGNVLDIPSLQDEDGYEGMGYKLVSYDIKFDQIIKSVLGKTVIVDDIDNATFLAKKYGYKFRIITLDGQIINAGGSFTGGSVKQTAGIISRKQEISEIGGQLEKLKEKLELSRSSYSDLQAEVRKMEIEIEGFKEQSSKFAGEEIRITAELGGVKNLISQCNEQQENAEIIIDKQQKQIAEQKSIVESYSVSLKGIEAEIEANDKLIEAAGEQLKEITSVKSKAADVISELNMKKIRLEKDVESIEQRINQIKQNISNLGKNDGEYTLEIERIDGEIAQIKASIVTKKDEILQINTSFEGNRTEINEVIGKVNRLEARTSEIQKDIREKSEAKEKFSNALVIQQERREIALRDIQKLKSGLWDKYQLTVSEAKEQAVELDDVHESKNKLLEIRRKLTALGNINYAAIDEYIEVSARYNELSAHLKDIEKSKNDLEKLIANLTADIKTKFLTSFNDINEQFKRIFKEVFGGGQGHLELTDPDDILNTGIEIYAAPPGKLVKSLSLLSGGEQTMVAITIYFAILLHRPTPFCMLDEVDAALDEVNVIKYVTYLKRFSADTQLMVITHRRGTIEGCDVLYGVYMQEKGVSRLLRQEIIDDLEVELS